MAKEGFLANIVGYHEVDLELLLAFVDRVAVERLLNREHETERRVIQLLGNLQSDGLHEAVVLGWTSRRQG